MSLRQITNSFGMDCIDVGLFWGMVWYPKFPKFENFSQKWRDLEQEIIIDTKIFVLLQKLRKLWSIESANKKIPLNAISWPYSFAGWRILCIAVAGPRLCRRCCRHGQSSAGGRWAGPGSCRRWSIRRAAESGTGTVWCWKSGFDLRGEIFICI